MLDAYRHALRPQWLRILALGAALAIFAAACGGGGGGGGGGGATGARKGVPKDSGKPVAGGSVTYGLEAETLGGWCLPAAQLAAGGIEVAQAIYDTLTVPNDKGDYVPYLAKSVDHNPDYTQWTVGLREGIKFHDGTPFNADAVVQNFDAFRKGILFAIVFQDITKVEKVDDLTVRFTSRVPWVAFPAFLWGTGRIGMSAPAQLNDTQNCARNLIGTGPFKFREWTPNDKLVAVKNPDYWQKDKAGNPLPYLDQITFRPQEDVSQRVNGLKGGDLDIIQLTDGQQITRLRDDANAGTAKLLETDRAAEIAHTMLNAGKPPFNNLNARLAVAYAADRDALNQLNNNKVTDRADGPYAPETLGYLKNPGFPNYDPAKAKQYVDKYKQETGQSELHFTLNTTPDPSTQALASLVKNQGEKIDGIKVDIAPPTEQSQYINVAIGGDYQAILWRNFPGGDPDTLTVWWHSTAQDPNTGGTKPNFIDFGRINDPQIDKDLEQGRSETDPAKRKALYQDISKQFAKNAYNVWGWYEDWTFAAKPNVNGLEGPPLPSGDARGLPIASVEPVLGLWVSKG